MLKGLRDFIARGNVVDLAVGVVIGAAFEALVSQFVKSFFDPLIKWALPGEGVGGTVVLDKAKNAVIDYGAFVSAAITFLLTAVAVYFFVVVPMNKLIRRRDEKASDEVALLTEIRDALRSR